MADNNILIKVSAFSGLAGCFWASGAKIIVLGTILDYKGKPKIEITKVIRYISSLNQSRL